MRFTVERHEVRMYPEGPVDEAYIEEVLGLKRDGDLAVAMRQNAMGLSCIGCIRITKRILPPTEDKEVGT